MKDLRSTRGNRKVRAMIAEGEHETQDFKYAISDARKIARSISAFANNRGGRLLIGVKDNGVIAGVRNEEDVFVVEQAAERYCRPAQTVDFKAYRIDGALCVIVAEVEAAIDRPVSAGEADGTWRAYYRVADENIAAHPLMVRAWKLSASPLGATITPGGPLSRMLELLGGREYISDGREAALELHISQDAADEAVARLASMDLVEFFYEGGVFRIRLKRNQ